MNRTFKTDSSGSTKIWNVADQVVQIIIGSDSDIADLANTIVEFARQKSPGKSYGYLRKFMRGIADAASHPEDEVKGQIRKRMSDAVDSHRKTDEDNAISIAQEVVSYLYGTGTPVRLALEILAIAETSGDVQFMRKVKLFGTNIARG